MLVAVPEPCGINTRINKDMPDVSYVSATQCGLGVHERLNFYPAALNRDYNGNKLRYYRLLLLYKNHRTAKPQCAEPAGVLRLIFKQLMCFKA